MMVSQITEQVGAISSTVFILQIAMQLKLYGFKCWLNLGLGTGTPVVKARKEEKELEQAGEDVVKEVVKGAEDIEHKTSKDFKEIEEWL